MFSEYFDKWVTVNLTREKKRLHFVKIWSNFMAFRGSFCQSAQTVNFTKALKIRQILP